MVTRRLATIFFAAAFVAGPSGAAPVLATDGHWAALDRGRTCEAASRSLLAAPSGRPQAIAGFAFDAGGPRHGQLFVRLSREARPGSSIMLKIGEAPFLLVGRGDWAWSRGPQQEAAILAAARGSGSMRIVFRGTNGRRYTDRYLLDGAPTAIDAAAAACAAKLVKRRTNP